MEAKHGEGWQSGGGTPPSESVLAPVPGVHSEWLWMFLEPGLLGNRLNNISDHLALWITQFFSIIFWPAALARLQFQSDEAVSLAFWPQIQVPLIGTGIKIPVNTKLYTMFILECLIPVIIRDIFTHHRYQILCGFVVVWGWGFFGLHLLQNVKILPCKTSKNFLSSA